MAMKDDSLHYPTENIVSKRPRRHYRVPVRSQHWQLRSLISAEKTQTVYFPGGSGSNHVQRLNTQTRECETIKLLTFAPRCLVAKEGWLCCGSEQGDFVAIHLDEDAARDGPNRRTPERENSDLSLDFDPPIAFGESQGETLMNLITRARRGNKSLIAKNVKLAKERVNCITLWFPPRHLDPHESAYNFPVAVLANNDRTVTLVHLDAAEDPDKLEAMEVIPYPDFVNRAIISPDGRLLIAILDDPYLYIHERTPKASQSSSIWTQAEPSYSWELKQKLLLKSQKKEDRSDSRGSFAASFSASGAYLAVGTQHGTISIFDASLLTSQEADPLITTFTSSRPKSAPGAVRDMAFCPGPYDILAWTEDRGHIGFADVRSNFVVRQVVDITEEADFEHITVLDRNTVDPRLLDRRTDRLERLERLESNATGTGSGSRNTGEGRRRGVDGLNNINYPLTSGETSVLEALQDDRRRRDRLNQRSADEPLAASRSTSNLLRPETNNFFRTGRVPVFPTDEEEPIEPQGRDSTSRAILDLLGNYRDQRDRAHERVRSARQLLRDASERPAIRRADQRWMDRLGETVAAMRDMRERDDASYLNVLELLQSREPTNNEGEDDASLLVPLVNQVVTRWEESAIRGTLAQDHGVFDLPPSPDNTAGLAWSEDGRTLFVGAQNGIYEFPLNVQSRKLCPSLQPR